MSEMKPKFVDAVQKIIMNPPNPYVNAPSCHVNLLELSRHAKKMGKKLSELTREEVSNFLHDSYTIY